MQRTYADTVRHGRYSGYVEYPYRQAYSQRPDRHQGHHVLMEKMNDFFWSILALFGRLSGRTIVLWRFWWGVWKVRTTRTSWATGTPRTTGIFLWGTELRS